MCLQCWETAARSQFATSAFTPSNRIAKYRLDASGGVSCYDYILDLAVLDQEVCDSARVETYGQVRNDRAQSLCYIAAVATFYDYSGRIWYAGEEHSEDGMALTPGEKGFYNFRILSEDLFGKSCIVQA